MKNKLIDLKNEEFNYNSLLPIYFKHMTIHRKTDENIRKVNIITSKIHQTEFHMSKNFYKQICTINFDE